jgi:allantoin racemase
MHAASVLAPGFSVVTTLSRTCGMAWHLAERYGMKRFCRNVRATDVAVLELDRPGSAARRIILDECRRALDEDGSDAIVLGCAGMAELCAEIEDALGAPVVEGVTAAVKWVEALVSLRLGTAKRGDYARPLAKRYDGAFERFSPTGEGEGVPKTAVPGGGLAVTEAARPGVNAGVSGTDALPVVTTHIHSV